MLTPDDLSAIGELIESKVAPLKEGQDLLREEMKKGFDNTVDMIQTALGDAGEIAQREVDELREEINPKIDQLQKIHPQGQHPAL